MPDKIQRTPMLMSVRDAAGELGVSPDTIYHYAKERKNSFPAIHIGKRVMIVRSELYAWKEKNEH